jgi:co-chaperonin GroES (HSP10)
MSTVEKTAPEATEAELEAGLPRIEETYESGLIKADTVRRQEEVATVIAAVLELGPDAYNDKAKFPNGPWCKVGDYVILRAYSGTRFRLHGNEFRLINDDTVEGVVADPRGYSRV